MSGAVEAEQITGAVWQGDRDGGSGRSGRARARGGFWTDAQDDPIVRTIIQAIASGRLGAGIKLGEEELGALFGVGRTRVRQALQALSFAGLVQLQAHRGAFIASPTLDEAEALYAARRLIEAEIVRDAARHCTANDIRKLRRHCEAQEGARSDQERFLRLLSEFHLLIADIGGNVILAELLGQLLPRTALMQALYQPEGKGGGGCAVAHHLEIVRLMALGDEQAAADALCAHLTINVHELTLQSQPRPQQPLAVLLGMTPCAG